MSVWVSGDPVNNPNSGSVLVTYVFGADALVRVSVAVGWSVPQGGPGSLETIFQYLAPPPTVTRRQHIPAASPFLATAPLGPFAVRAGDEIRLLVRNAFKGEAQASLFVDG